MKNIWQKIINACIYSLVFLMPLFWLPFTFEAFNFNKVYLLFSLVSVGVLAWIGKMIFEKQEIKFYRTPLDFIILGFMILAGVGSCFSLDKTSTLMGSYGRFWPSLLGMLSLGAFYFLFTNHVGLKSKEENEEDIKPINIHILFRTFLISCLAVLSVGFLSIFGVWKMLLDAGVNLPVVMRSFGFTTAGGSLESLGIFLSVVIVFVVGILSCKETVPFLKKKKGILLYVLLSLSLGFLVLTNIWSAWAVLSISCLLFVAYSFWKGLFRANVNRLRIPIFVLILSLTFLLVNPLKNVFPENSSLANLPYEILLRGNASWGIGVKGLQENAVFGPGLSNFDYAFSKFKPEGLLKTDFWNLRFDRSGNYMAEVLATNGVVGFLTHIGFAGVALTLFFFAINSRVRKKEKIKIENLAPMPFFFAFIAVLASQFFYYQNVLLSFVFWFCLAGLAVSFDIPSKKKIFSFKEFPEVGLVLNVVFWLLIVGSTVASFFLGKQYIADVNYRNFLTSSGNDLTTIERAVKMAPKVADYHITLSRAYWSKFVEESRKESSDEKLKADLIAASINEAKLAQAVSPKRVTVYENLAEIYGNSIGIVEGTADWAIKTYERALELEPNNPVFLTEIGRIKEIKGETEIAKEYYQKASDLGTKYIVPQVRLALMLEKAGNINEAIKKLEEAVQNNSSDTEGRFQLGRLYYNNKETDKAKKQFEIVLSTYPDHSNSLYLLGLIYEDQGRIDLAIRLFERVAVLNPGNETVAQKINSLKKSTFPNAEKSEE